MATLSKQQDFVKVLDYQTSIGVFNLHINNTSPVSARINVAVTSVANVSQLNWPNQDDFIVHKRNIYSNSKIDIDDIFVDVGEAIYVWADNDGLAIQTDGSSVTTTLPTPAKLAALEDRYMTLLDYQVADVKYNLFVINLNDSSAKVSIAITSGAGISVLNPPSLDTFMIKDKHFAGNSTTPYENVAIPTGSGVFVLSDSPNVVFKLTAVITDNLGTIVTSTGGTSSTGGSVVAGDQAW